MRIVYSPEQNGVFCDCFASFEIAKTFILKLKCLAFIRNTSFTENWKGRLKNWVFVSSVRILVPSRYWATYILYDKNNLKAVFVCSSCLFTFSLSRAQAYHAMHNSVTGFHYLPFSSKIFENMLHLSFSMKLTFSARKCH